VEDADYKDLYDSMSDELWRARQDESRSSDTGTKAVPAN